jgi:uncharacterized glyoxalase superfamily protein PhnB
MTTPVWRPDATDNHGSQHRGLPIQQALVDRAWGHREFAVTDPNGIKIALFSPIA